MKVVTRSVALPIVGFVFVSSLAVAQQEMADVEITTTHVAKGIYMLQGRGGNMGLSVGADGAFLVDDQFAPLTQKIQAAVSDVTDQSVEFVLNTHWHGDHTGGNENFGKAGAMIVAHDNVRKRLNPAEFKELMGRSRQEPPDALPVITFTDAVTFHWNDEAIHVFHVARAHTDGDAIVHFRDANIVHMGDTFFNGRYPFIDVDSGGDVHGVITAADRVLALADANTRIIPGHGALAGPAELQSYRNMLATVRDRVAEMLAQRMTEDQVVAAQPTKDFDATWGSNAERLVRAVFRGVANR
jgi:glyoxylase-like metal-dependent hydrolase (beta-lactamase superfamily II)